MHQNLILNSGLWMTQRKGRIRKETLPWLNRISWLPYQSIKRLKDWSKDSFVSNCLFVHLSISALINEERILAQRVAGKIQPRTVFTRVFQKNTYKKKTTPLCTPLKYIYPRSKSFFLFGQVKEVTSLSQK